MINVYNKYPELIKIIKYINEINPSNNLPYHGIDHLFTVFEYTNKIYENNYSDNKLINELELYVAALFHDFAHSGGKLKDNENINNAIIGLKTYAFKNKYSFNIKEVEYLIKTTEFPYSISEDNLTLSGKILRDADMSYLLQDISIVKLFQGLRTEFNKDLSVFIEEQFNFYNSIKFYTEFMQNQWEIIKDQRIKELVLLQG